MSVALILIGSLTLCAGIWLIYQPAAIITAGLILSLCGVVLALGDREE